jgi:hypothetical protein
MFGLALPAFAQYAGPAILSRGEAPAALSVPSIDFAFSVAIGASYTDGLVGITTNNQENLARTGSYGGSLTLGLSGAHSWKHTRIGLAYSGSVSAYVSAPVTGISQGLSLGLSHQFSRHLTFHLSESAGWFTQFPPATVTLNSSVPFDPSQSNIPTTDFYDNRTIYSSTSASMIYQATSRLSFSVGGGYFTDLRRSSALYSAKGESASGDVQYRLSRRVTVGGSYGFSHYGFSGNLGGSYIHTVGLSMSSRFSQRTEFSFFGGASFVSSSFEQTVPISPAILAILCPPNLVAVCPLTPSLVISNNTLWAPNFGARISRSFQRGAVYANVGESITPGNGLFLTSRAQTASAGYGYSGLKKWSMSINIGYTRALSLGNIQGGYGQVSGGFGVSRQIFSHVSFVSSFSATQYQSATFADYNHLIYSASVGLGFSSKNIPVRFF